MRQVRLSVSMFRPGQYRAELTSCTYQLFSFCQTNRTAGKMSKTGSIRVTYRGAAFVLPFLQWKKKIISITYSKSVSAALGMAHAIIGGLSDSTIFFHTIL